MRKFYCKISTACAMLLLFTASAFAQPDKYAAFNDYKNLLVKNADRFGLSNADMNGVVISDAYTDNQSGITYVYLQQYYSGIELYNTVITAAFKKGGLVSFSGNFIKNVSVKAGSAFPVQSPVDAINSAAGYLSLPVKELPVLVKNNSNPGKQYFFSAAGIAKRNIEVKLVWLPSADRNSLQLCWNVNIDVIDSPDWWNIRIDAITGKYLDKDNWTVSEGEDKITPVDQFRNNEMPSAPKILPAPPAVTTATYNVIPYPVESPNFGTAANVTDPWLMAGAGNNATSYGWHYDGSTTYNLTRGNNVFAFLDVNNTDIPNILTNWPDTSTTAIPALTFNNTPIYTSQPSSSPNQVNKKFALDNLFYWNNLMHDVMYQYGFTEPAGNFQADNILRGGAGGDQVMANAQDGGGYNNANFTTPADGTSGKMQMYLWSGTALFTVNTPAAIANTYAAIEGTLTTTAPSKLINTGPVTNTVVLYNDDVAGTIHRGCAAATNAVAIAGHIAMLDNFAGGGACTTYAYKIKNAQNAGAVAVIIYSNTGTIPSIAGNDAVSATITIPVIAVSNTTGGLIMTQLGLGNAVNITMASGIYLDGDIDNGIVCHEFGHGISNRLTGGPSNVSCLSNIEQAGEGWSDYFGLMMTTNWATANLTDGSLARPLATYAYNQPATGAGIRRYPYSANIVTDPLTYTDMPAINDSHAIGEIWCAALWDMTWNIIQQQGIIAPNLYNAASTGGNAIALNLVMTGLKLQTCNPGFLDSRNAILTADSLLYNNAHRCAIWAAFARRGMGANASQGSPYSIIDGTAGFNAPASVHIAKLSPAKVTATTVTTITHTVTCDCQAVNGYIVRDTIPAGFTYLGSNPAGVLAGNVLSYPATNFASTEAKDFSLTLQAPAVGCDIDTVINDNRETNTVGGFASSGTGAWSASSVKSHSGSSSWFVPDATSTISAKLTSSAAAALAGKNLSVFSFWHYFNTESVLDGGVVEYSTDGTNWTDASALFFPNTYTNTVLGASGLSGRMAYSGGNRAFEHSMINASSFGTTPVQFRFRFETDASIGSEGWYVDDIQRVNGCGAFVKTAVYNSSNAVQDTTLTPVFVTQSVVGLDLLTFNASLKNGRSALDWHTAYESLHDYGVEWSTDNIHWLNIGTVMANNHSANDYYFIHAGPVKGNNYYRLKMNEANGAFSFSPVRIVLLKGGANDQPLLVPNPANETAELYIAKDSKPTSIKIFNSLGSLIAEKSVPAGMQELKIFTGAYPGGMYMIEVSGSQRHMVRLVVQH